MKIVIFALSLFVLSGLSYAMPPSGTPWQIQYAGQLNLDPAITIYNIDLEDTSAATIANMKSQGKFVICYFSAGSYENWRSDEADFPASVLGRNLDGWAGEKWLDVRQRDILMPIMRARMRVAVDKGCNAVDPDNVDGYTNNTSFPLTKEDQVLYNKAISNAAHNLGLEVGLKNSGDQVPDLVHKYDFAVNEQCHQYNECEQLTPFIDAGKPVYNIEYGYGANNLNEVCADSAALGFDTLIKKLSLNAYRVACP